MSNEKESAPDTEAKEIAQYLAEFTPSELALRYRDVEGQLHFARQMAKILLEEVGPDCPIKELPPTILRPDGRCSLPNDISPEDRVRKYFILTNEFNEIILLLEKVQAEVMKHQKLINPDFQENIFSNE